MVIKQSLKNKMKHLSDNNIKDCDGCKLWFIHDPEMKCHIPLGSIVKITAHVNNNAFCSSYMNNRYARIEGRKMTLYALHPNFVSITKPMYRPVILKRQLFR